MIRLIRALALCLGLVWVSQDFPTLNQLVTFLNQLPVERQAEAKVVTIGPKFGHAVSQGYALLYRVEQVERPR